MPSDITWTASAHTHTEKTSDWFWALGIVAVSSAAVSFLFQNMLFALLIIVGAFTLALLASRPQREITFSLTRRGIMVDDVLFPYQMLVAFWVQDLETDSPILIVDVHKVMTPHIIVSLENVDAEQVHEYLSTRLPEEEMFEPIEQVIFERLGF